MPIDFNDNLQIRAPKPIDDRYGPWETIEEGLINVPYPYRHIKLTLNIAGVEYWFKDGLEDLDLIVKEYGSGDTSKWEQDNISAATTLHPRWNDSNNATIYGTDRFGLNMLPSDFIQSNSSSVGVGSIAMMHTTGFFDYPINTQPKQIMLFASSSDFVFSGNGKRAGCCVRAVRNATIEEQLLPNGLISATYTDYDGNIYKCTKIGLQVWTTSHLKVTHYADGTLIPTNLSDAAWAADSLGAMTISPVPLDELTTEALMVAAYGRLYNWYAVTNAHGLIDSTDGWHVPTDAEFTQLSDYLIATYPEITSDNVGDALKSIRQVNSPYVITDQVHIKPKLNKRIDANIIDGLPDVSSYPTIEEVQILLNEKEDKNVVITSYYVSTLNELILAWSEARTSSLPTNIYAAGTITLTSNLYLQEHQVHGRHIAIIGVPNATINLNGYTLTSAGAYYENLSFSNPNLSGYLFNENGYINCKNCNFVTDGLDTSYNLRLPIPHITITGLGSGGSTGSIVIDGIQHNTNVYEWNRDNLIQPILISITAAGFAKLYVSLKNVTALSSFDRFSRLQIITSGANSIFVTGDTTWFYAPEQLMPGQGFINSDSLILRKSSLSNIKLEGLLSGTSVKILGIDVNNNLILNDVLTSNQLQIINTVPLVCSDEKTDIVASLTESKIKFVFQTPQSFTNIIGELNVSAVGGTFTVDVTKNGVSILSTYLTFDSGETSTRTALIPKVLTTSPVSFDIGDYVEVFVRIVGALVPGKGLKIYLM